MVKVKICGITNSEDAQVSIGAGCDALGFVFYKKSPRYITPQKANKIIKLLPPEIIKIGVFANAREKTIRRIAGICHLNILQFHGTESPEFCQRFKEYKIIKAFRIRNKLDLRNVFKYKVFACLFDTFMNTKLGGTGRSFNWKLIRHIDGLKCPVFLSGGLNEKNVAKAVKIVHPDWVDVSSSLEVSPGKKNPQKLKKFIKKAKGI